MDILKVKREKKNGNSLSGNVGGGGPGTLYHAH